MSTGPGGKDDSCKTMAMEVKKGDGVLYSKYSGTEGKIEGKEHLRENGYVVFELDDK